MLERLLKTILFLNILFFTSLSFSQSETLFSSREPLRLRVEGDWSDLLQKRYLAPSVAKLARIPVQVVIVNAETKAETRVNAEVGLRGNTSLSPMECSFPKFSLYFSEENVSGTLLAGREQLAVGSHCSYRGGNSSLYGRAYDGKSPHREAMTYRLLEILEMASFQTRPLLIQYVETGVSDGPVSVMWHQAFVLESLKQFSQRMNYELIDEDLANLVDLGAEKITDLQRLARVALFNEMIGNNDWRINYNDLPSHRQTWNVYLARNYNNPNIEVIPNDFDLASVVTMLNDKPDAPLELLKKIPENEVSQAKNFFRGKREALLEEIKALQSLDPAGYQQFKMKLEQFFASKIAY